MYKYFFIIFVCTVLCACNEKEKSNISSVRKPSEMSVLMNKMYTENETIKKKILNGEDLSSFPKEYLKIHTATLTDPSDRTSQFNGFSELYLGNLRKVFHTRKDSVAYQFNQTVNSCIACHQSTCPGPIPKIKKLLIP